MGRVKGMSNIILAILLTAVLFAATGGSAIAALSAPNWMPNAPIMAGAQVILLWLPVPGAVKYNIYLDNKKIAEAAGVQHVISTPETAGEYSLRIAGVDSSGAEGAKSSPGVIRIVLIEPPKGVIARMNQDKVAVRWDRVNGAVIYKVYRSEKAGGEKKLLASVQGEAYTDGQVAKGKIYYYSVSSKDLAGKESANSATVQVSLVEDKAQVAAKKIPFKAVASTEIGRIGYIDSKPLYDLSDVKWDPTAKELVILRENRIYRVNLSGNLIAAFPPIDNVQRFNKVDFGPDGAYYVTAGLTLHAFERDGSLKWKAEIPKPSLEEKAIWETIPDRYRVANGAAEAVMCLKDEIWVGDPRFGIIYVFDYTGKFRRYVYSYIDDTGKKVHTPSITALENLSGDRVLLGFALNHVAIGVDKDMKEVFSIGKIGGEGLTSRIVGIAGMYQTGSGNIIITDAAANSVQEFDKDGNYLYSIGGEDAVEDKAQKGRAKIDFGSVLINAQYVNEKDFVIYVASDKAIHVRRLK